MARTLSWWRNAGMALAALVLTALTFGPSLDGVICRGEAGLTAAAAEMPAVQAAPDHAFAGHANDGLEACVHGHCHHTAPYVPAASAGTETPDDLIARADPPSRDRAPTSDPKFGLKRPPRA